VRVRLLALACGAAASQLGAQEPVTVPCRGQRIDSIHVDAQAPTVVGLRRVPVVGSVVRNSHVITRANVVRGFLLLRIGDACNELRRAESERILRAQPFIADASVDVVPNRRGGVNLDVKTIDEASLIVSASVANTAPNVRSVKLGNGNLAGVGVYTSFSWRHQPFYDDRLEFRLSDYQFGGRPYVFNINSRKDRFGRDDNVELTLPFRTDVQRYAWRALLGESRSHVGFTERDSGRLALGFGREYAEMGGIIRIGPPGKLTLFGLSFTNERSFPDTGARRITELGFRPDTAAAFAGRFMETEAARINALLGVRGLIFRRVRGFDALRGTQDIPIGLQFGTLIGRAVPAFGSDAKDLFVASDLYMGFGSPRRIYRIQMQGEGRRTRGTGEWTGLVGSGRLSRYSKPADWRTRMFIVEWSGTEAVTHPHSLSLVEPGGGIRGYREMASVGGRRAVARIGEQFYAGSPFDFGDLGFGWFADAGQLWAGDLPYGENTDVFGSVGASILLAVPRRSTRMWRLEVAAPINREMGARHWEVRLTHSDLTAFFWREPADVDATRARAVPSSVYSWP
jgi:hypothetical protein